MWHIGDNLVITIQCLNEWFSAGVNSPFFAIFRFFHEIILPPSDKPQVKIPSKLKDALREAREAFEKRLKAEQKVVSDLISYIFCFHPFASAMTAPKNLIKV